MDIDMAVLRSMEREKDIPVESVAQTIEAALLQAYHRTEGAHRVARVVLDRKTGHVTVWAREELEPAGGEPAAVGQPAESRHRRRKPGAAATPLPPEPPLSCPPQRTQVPGPCWGRSSTHSHPLLPYRRGNRQADDPGAPP